MHTNPALDLSAIAQRFRARLVETAPMLRAGLDAQRKSGYAEDLDALRIQVHRISGLAGSLGLDRLGAASARLDPLLADAGNTKDDAMTAAATEFLSALAEAIAPRPSDEIRDQDGA